ncbi:GIN domain-containing protein [Phenylobacterium soli]|uniref:Putative auto-transporter adhesin head GIN domain-containing protein n=1 Tax=Phenylobacterium soli TaxID=2170551 RepID=A0A328AKE3_9CAUL|nr:DUF2807 domain-containing protein [Phenylobacterium soli]RAK55069.1 hypothetical protein DJ017_11340 [Phenylobacterium soli]
MRIAQMLTAAAGAGALTLAFAGVADAASVEVKDAVARVTVIPENRSDVKVEFLATNPRLPMKIRSFGGRTIVDGDLGRRIRSCRGSGQSARVEVRGVGEVGWNEMPQVVIHTPRAASVEAGGAVFGSVGRSAALELGNAGCGDWTVANVEGRLKLSQAGSGNTRTGAAGEAKIRVAGSGDVWTAEVHGPLDVDIAGSGNVTVASVSGPLEVRVAGSGDVKVSGGHATSMSVAIAGSGDVDFGGVADSLKARIAGSGDVHAREVRGAISKAVMGSGGVSVGE